MQADLNTFCLQFGIPTTTLNICYPTGKPVLTPATSEKYSWALETAMDVEWAHVIAPGANIMVVVAPTAGFGDLFAAITYAVANGATNISMSWGGPEWSSEAYYDTYFNHVGVNFTASSGDSGYGVNWPAACPYVVGVGGTTLIGDTNGNVIGETAWVGSGGGVSAYETAPSYQAGWQSTNKRCVPDVSYNGDPASGVSVYISNYNGYPQWMQVGGTSAGAPQWAALFALSKNLRKTNFTYGSNLVYDLANLNYSLYYKDITTGNNGAGKAGAKYDCVTGLGSPNAAQVYLEFGY